MSPALKVEIEWVSGSGTFADVSADLLKPANVTITRGRTGSDRKISGGTMTLMLRNDSGQYTPELNADVRRGRRIRLSAFVNGGWKVRFTGYVNQWSVGNIRVGAGSQCTLACIDGQAFFGAPMGPTVREILESYGCVAYWPMTETDGTVFSEQIGRGYPALSLLQSGNAGVANLATAPGLQIDDAAPVLQLVASSGKGWYVQSARMFAAPAAFTFGMWLDGTASAQTDMPVAQLSSGNSLMVQLVRTGAGAFNHFESYGQNFSGRAVSGATEPGVVMFSLGGTSIAVRPMGGTVTGASTRLDLPYPSTQIRLGYAPLSPFSGDLADNMNLGHAFLLDQALTAAQMDEMAEALVAAITAADARIEQWYGWAGEPQAVATLGAAPSTVQPATDGQTPAELAQTMAEGLAARTLFSRDGQPLWIGADYRPTPVTIQPGWIDADSFQFATTPDQYISKVDATLPSGGTYTYAKDNPEIRNPESITGVAADDALTQAVAQWIANSADGGARAPQLTIHLDRRTAAEQATIADLDIASRMTLASLPSTLPSSLAVVGEGYTETFGDTWDMSWNLSQDVDLFVWDESNWDDGPVWGI